MNKKQRKRREKQARNHAQGTLHCETLVEQKGADINQTEKPDAQEQPSKREKKISRFQRFLKLANNNSGAIMAVLTAVLVSIGGLQACIYSRQLDVIQKDQRPWIKVTPKAAPEITIENPVVAQTFEIINIGKSPAKDIAVKYFVEEVKNYSEPEFSASDAGRFSTGILFPNEPSIDPENGVPKELMHLYQKNYIALTQGQIYFVIYGIATYDDVFGTKHWTKFCRFAAPNLPGTHSYSAKKCTDYNNTDND